MCPSTDSAGETHEFAADVLEKLLRHIAVENAKNSSVGQPGHYVFHVSHAWTDGPMMYVVYQTPPLAITWGLVRDTRESLIDSGPWDEADNPALYYYMLDFEEGWSGPLSPQPGEDPDMIHWRGDQREDLPRRASDIPPDHRHTPTPIPAAQTQPSETSPADEPRRYADPS